MFSLKNPRPSGLGSVNKEILEYTYVEIPIWEEKERIAEGWVKYGMRKDHDIVYVKLRRPIDKEQK